MGKLQRGMQIASDLIAEAIQHYRNSAIRFPRGTR